MTWLDGLLIVVLLVFIGAGARLGSLWTGAALIGGFFGAYLADTYAVAMSGYMGHFPGVHVVSAVLLFLGGLLIFLIPGYLLSRIGSALFLGFIDGAFGLFTGAFAGLAVVSLTLLLVVPLFPKIERSAAWRNSALVKPFDQFLEDVVGDAKNFSHLSLKKKFDFLRHSF